jgi:glycerate dehydrogenase
MPEKPSAVFLDTATVGPGVDMSALEALLDIEYYESTDKQDVAQRIADREIVIVNKTRIDRAAIEAAKRVKLIVLTATGTDNVDSRAAQEASIGVANTRDYCNTSVVQHVFGLILSLTQHTHRYDALVSTGAWQRSNTFALFDYPIRELAGCNLGVVGYGSLGQSVAELGRCLGMNLLISARPGATDIPQGRLPFDQVLRQSDVLTLHCPLTEHTQHLLGAEAFTAMKRDAILINTARGGLVDGAALVKALETGEIAGAGIDVLATEPPNADDPILSTSLPNLIVTPHIAWAAREARQRAVDQVAANIADFYAGGRLRRIV